MNFVLLNSSKIITDESNITGEHEHLHKIGLGEDENPHTDSDSFLLAKSTVMIGKGIGVVGKNTSAGQAVNKLRIVDEITPRQVKLENL